MNWLYLPLPLPECGFREVRMPRSPAGERGARLLSVREQLTPVGVQAFFFTGGCQMRAWAVIVRRYQRMLVDGADGRRQEMEIEMDVDVTEVKASATPEIENDHLRAAADHVGAWLAEELQTGKRDRFARVKRVCDAMHSLIRSAEPSVADFAEGEPGGIYQHGRIGGADQAEIMRQLMAAVQPAMKSLEANNQETVGRVRLTLMQEMEAATRTLEELAPHGMDATRAVIKKRIEVLTEAIAKVDTPVVLPPLADQLARPAAPAFVGEAYEPYPIMAHNPE